MDRGKEKRPTLAVVILNFNGGELLTNCLESIFRSDHEPTEIVVVDNASTDNSIEMAKYRFALGVKYILLKKNLGFSSGNNVGLRNVTSEVVLFLNNDLVVEVDTIGNLLDGVVELPKDLLQPRIVISSRPEVLHSEGLSLHPAGFGILVNGGLRKNDRTDVLEIFAPTGACLMGRRDTLMNLGGFNEILFSFLEDLDLGWRAKLMGGKSYCIRNCQVRHVWGASWGKMRRTKLYNVERSRWVILLSNYRLRTVILLAPLLILTDAMVLIHSGLNGWFGLKIRAYADVLKMTKSIRIMRRRIQSTRVVSDSELKLFLTYDLTRHDTGNYLNLANLVLRPMARFLCRFV